MPLPIEDYAVIGDTETAALVGRNGSIDWLCVPRFDAGAIFAALLGTEEHGRWLIAPASSILATRRRYRGDTMVLETEFDTDEGTVRLIDFMPIRGEATRKAGLESDKPAWDLQRALIRFVENNWNTPDEGIWEVRGSSRHFTHSKLMAWVAADRAVKAVEQTEMDGPVDRWRAVRDEIRRDIMSKGFDEKRNTFTQYYGSKELDAAVLMMPLVGFLPATDQRIQGTVAAIEKELLENGFVQRYTQEPGAGVDGLPPGEGAFLACTFWLAQNYALMGRRDDAREVFERLLGLCNDVGLLSEEYDTKAERLVGNFPQAFSHVPLIDTARTLTAEEGKTYPRQREKEATPVPRREDEEAPVA